MKQIQPQQQFSYSSDFHLFCDDIESVEQILRQGMLGVIESCLYRDRQFEDSIIMDVWNTCHGCRDDAETIINTLLKLKTNTEKIDQTWKNPFSCLFKF